nr:hypothetical protein [Tanacetum cinerariifolium]
MIPIFMGWVMSRLSISRRRPPLARPGKALVQQWLAVRALGHLQQLQKAFQFLQLFCVDSQVHVAALLARVDQPRVYQGLHVLRHGWLADWHKLIEIG